MLGTFHNAYSVGLFIIVAEGGMAYIVVVGAGLISVNESPHAWRTWVKKVYMNFVQPHKPDKQHPLCSHINLPPLAADFELWSKINAQHEPQQSNRWLSRELPKSWFGSRYCTYFETFNDWLNQQCHNESPGRSESWRYLD